MQIAHGQQFLLWISYCFACFSPSAFLFEGMEEGHAESFDECPAALVGSTEGKGADLSNEDFY